MSGFSSASLSRLDYDFTGFKASDGSRCKGKGVGPEPSAEAITDFGILYGELLQGLEDTPDEDKLKTAFSALAQALAELTQGQPSEEELAALPPRALAGFARWLMGELNPKGLASGMRRSPGTKTSVC